MERLGRRVEPVAQPTDQPGEFVYYTTYHPGLKLAVQQTLVVRRDDCKASEYIIWLN